MTEMSPSRSIGELVSDRSILAIQDGNHGESHPKASEYVEEGIPFIMASDIRDGRLILSGAKRLPRARTDKLRIGFALPGDVLLSHKGTVGEVAIVPNMSDYVMLTPQVTYYRTNREKLDPRYLAFAFRSPSFQAQLLNISAQSTRPYVAISTQRHLTVPWHPIADQRRIASNLGAYDDLIEVNLRRTELLEEIARRLFEEWFVRFWSSDADALPAHWRMGVAFDLIDFDPPTRLPRVGLAPFVPMSSLDTRTSVIEGPEQREAGSGAKFQNRDTLFARITPCLENGKTGLVRDLPGGGAGFGSTEFIVMRGRVAGPAFTYFLARNKRFRAHAQRSMSGASGRQRVRTESLRRFELALPPPALLDQFETVALPMLELAGRLGLANKALAGSRDLLLPRLISGELSLAAADQEVEAAA